MRRQTFSKPHAAFSRILSRIVQPADLYVFFIYLAKTQIPDVDMRYYNKGTHKKNLYPGTKKAGSAKTVHQSPDYQYGYLKKFFKRSGLDANDKYV